jgi:hypothetical protein
MTVLVGLVLGGLLQAATAQVVEASPSLETIVSKHLDAQGGLARLKAVRSISVTSTSSFDGKTTHTASTRARPNMFRYEMSDGTETKVKAFDGKVGWFSKDGSVEMVAADKLEGMKKGATFDDAMVDPAAHGARLALDGIEKVGGGEAFVVSLSFPNGDVQKRYIDTRSYLEVKRVATWNYEGKPASKTVHFSDFKTVDGVTVAMKSTFEKDGKTGTYQITRIELDGPVRTALFAPPAKAGVKAASTIPASTK